MVRAEKFGGGLAVDGDDLDELALAPKNLAGGGGEGDLVALAGAVAGEEISEEGMGGAGFEHAVPGADEKGVFVRVFEADDRSHAMMVAWSGRGGDEILA